MTGINGVGNSGLSYVDQLKELQEKKVQKEQKTTGQNELKQEDFLSLLTKQLAQQDPFKPVSNDQMIAQMASFATVDGINKMNGQFTSLNAAMTSNQALQASSLVGRNVLVSGNEATKSAETGLDAVANLPQAVDRLMVRIENQQGELVRSIDMGAKAVGEQSIHWDGRDDQGQVMPAGNYRIKANALINGENQEFDMSVFASVNSVLMGKGDGNVLLNLAGFNAPVKLADVKQVGEA
ncbi:Basal-body rod modification protein FlgD [Vibrio stylophorae]|uniref:Basal-body rod modification protein FlgD n=1 Tax=Vibrio stylophorae TaxID=659351 RepID=A0ABM8ZUX6_9VIBR|nr:flagellar hook assembly protein FlgD [Vibrio stylophorae]CAH0534134.1 Basal-body rod modification protein FlgD [Vibrio stylophorae]